MNTLELGITAEALRAQIVELAATKLVDEIIGNHDIPDRVDQMLLDRIEAATSKGLAERIEATLSAEMEKILRETITPVDIWGERTGEPTTIRDALAKRSREFWDLKVDKDGKPSTYGGRPRHEHLMSRLLNEEFTAAIKENATAIVAGFKTAVSADAGRLLAEHIDKLITVKAA